jgi:choice-of-anchor B domain-containing protein
MQVFDLTQLRDMKPSQPVFQFQDSAHYSEMGNTHNIVGNEETGFMYAVGTSTCRGGLHMINVRDPLNPQFSGCFGDDGYVHDAQCVVYDGPDEQFKGREICFCYNEDTLTIVDVQDKTNVRLLSRVPYNGAYYTHQGWLIGDQSHLLLNDELDELYGPTPNTRSMIWNVDELESPELIGSFYSKEQATDHNLYIRDNVAYESNYCAGLRVLNVAGIKSGDIQEIGYFDLAPDCNSPGFQGAWSSYPYFKSDTIVVSSIERGLFVLRYTGPLPQPK